MSFRSDGSPSRDGYGSSPPVEGRSGGVWLGVGGRRVEKSLGRSQYSSWAAAAGGIAALPVELHLTDFVGTTVKIGSAHFPGIALTFAQPSNILTVIYISTMMHA
jgi:hypothetical protein